MTPTGTTAVAGVIGSPVRHSLSPALHNAAFAARDLDAVYVAFEVAPEDSHAALDAIETLGLLGLSVTMPHKEPLAQALRDRGRLTDRADRLDAVNTVWRDAKGVLWGDLTDGEGFVASLRADAGWDPTRARCAVIGAGGAARAIMAALVEADATEVIVVNRSRDRATEAVAKVGGPVRVGAEADLVTCDLIVNATPVGMGTDGRSPVPVEVLRAHQVVADAVYHPLDTPLLVAARQVGARTVDGLGMLVHQAALQLQRWTGEAGDPTVMRAAALAELARRSA